MVQSKYFNFQYKRIVAESSLQTCVKSANHSKIEARCESVVTIYVVMSCTHLYGKRALNNFHFLCRIVSTSSQGWAPD